MPQIIYKITNTINNKIYIGKTIKDIKKRFREHELEAKRYAQCIKDNLDFGYETRLYPAINKYGIDNFSIEIIESFSYDINLNQKEIYYIKQYNSTDPDIGYNISPGGLGGPLFKGHKHSEAMKAKQSKKQLGKKWYNNGTVEIMVLKGTAIPEGFTLGRIYKGLKGKANPMYGKKGYNAGKHLSEETKNKLSATKRQNAATRKKIWVNNGVEELQVDLNKSSIPEMFIPGRLHRKTKLMREVYMYDLQNNFLHEFESLSAARHYTNISIECIIACCIGRTNSAGGYRWKYKQEK